MSDVSGSSGPGTGSYTVTGSGGAAEFEVMDPQPNTNAKLGWGTAAAAISTGITTCVPWALRTWAHVDMPAEVAIALGGAVSGIVGLMTAHFVPAGPTP